MSDTRDVYSRITDKIIAHLEQGVRPWHRPWNAEHMAGKITRPLRHSGVSYQGINVVMLWCAAATKGYACPFWLTFKQAQALGGTVKKGEHGELAVYADRITRTDTDEKGEETLRSIPFMKGYTVFNAEQCEGLPAHYSAMAEAPPLPLAQRCDTADRFFAATGAVIRHGGTRAYRWPRYLARAGRRSAGRRRRRGSSSRPLFELRENHPRRERHDFRSFMKNRIRLLSFS